MKMPDYFLGKPLLSKVQQIQGGFFSLPNFFFKIQLPCCPAQFKSFLPSLSAENACCQKLIYLFFCKGKQNSQDSTESVFLINVAAPPPPPPPI